MVTVIKTIHRLLQEQFGLTSDKNFFLVLDNGDGDLGFISRPTLSISKEDSLKIFSRSKYLQITNRMSPSISTPTLMLLQTAVTNALIQKTEALRAIPTAIIMLTDTIREKSTTASNAAVADMQEASCGPA